MRILEGIKSRSSNYKQHRKTSSSDLNQISTDILSGKMNEDIETSPPNSNNLNKRLSFGRTMNSRGTNDQTNIELSESQDNLRYDCNSSNL